MRKIDFALYQPNQSRKTHRDAEDTASLCCDGWKEEGVLEGQLMYLLLPLFCASAFMPIGW